MKVSRCGSSPTRWVEREGVGPDGDQSCSDGGLAQLGEVDPKARAVWEVAVVAPGAGEVRVDVETKPHVADDEEGRGRLVARQVADVAPRLTERARHVLIPCHTAPHGLSPGRLCRKGE